MASINLEKVKTLYGNNQDLQGQFIDYLRNVESELDFSKFEGLDDQAIFTNLMESGQKEIKVNPNNPAKPLNYRPRREQTYKELKPLDDEINNQPFYKDLAMRATQVLDQINPTPFRQKELEARRHKAQEILNHLKRSGVTSEQFAKEYGDSPFLREAYFENQDIFSNIFDLSHDTIAALFGGKNAQAKAYDFELESYNTYKTLAQRKLDNPSNYYKLTPQERKIIDQRLGAFSAWWHNDSDKEKVDLYLDLENAKESASNFVSAQKRLENVNSNEQFLGLIGALKHGKEFDKKQKAMIDDYAIVAKELGFDTLAYNKTGLYFIKDEKAYKVEQGLWDEIKGVFKDNIGSLAGAIAGAEYGYKKGKFKGMVIYGAAGAFGGGVTDSMIADVLANKKLDLAQALIHGAQEGALNIAADAVLKVAGTAIKTLNPEKLKNIAGTAIDYTPLLGFAKRAKDGNKAAAQKLIDHAIPQEAQADLKALESIFGAEVQIGATKFSQAQSAIRTLESKLGSDSYIVRGAQSLYDTFAFTSQKQAQKDFIRAIRADESGNLSAFLSEAANASPVIQKNLLDILHQTSQKLAHQLGRFDLPPSTIKDVFDNFEKGTKQSYTDAIEQILLKVYDESYTTTLAKDAPNIPSNLSSQEAARFNADSLEGFKAKMEKSGILLEDSAKFLHFVESSIYNPKGVTFESLNNALKTINAYHKQATDPNFRSFVKDAVNGFIKRDIQAGIEKIFAQNAPLYNDARTLFDTALSDYAKMKETLKLADSLKIRDRRRSYEQVAQSLSRFFLGQGDNIPNFEALLGSLPKSAREQVELKLLQDMLELSFVKLNDIKVLDSNEFFKRLEPLKGHFHSTSAKDFIKIAQDFHTLFRNDANIARSLSPATTEKIGTSIATTLEGAVKFQVIKALFTNIIRLMPHIPFAKRLNESVQGSALRYQLKKALDSSLSVGEFKLELQARAIKGDFTNATREQIAKILGQVENAQESLERVPAQPSLRADENAAPIHKETPSTPPAETQAQKVDSSVEHFGQNFSEYKGQGAKAVEKVLQERSGQVQGAFYRDELGEIDVVWGEITDPEKHKGYGLAHILDKRKAEFMQQGLSEAQAEAKAIDFTKNEIANIIENGKITNKPNEATKIETPAYKLILKQNWKGEPLENKWLVTAYIKNEKGESISSTPFTKGDNLPLNSSGNSTTLSPLEQAQAQKQATQEAQEAAQQAQRQADQEAAQAIKDRNDQIQHLKDSRAGKSEMEREVKIGEPIAMKRTEQPPTSIATDDNNIYQLDFVIVKARDVKPNFNADGLQPRTQKEHKTIESIAQNFKPEMVLGRGGYKDLPIIAKDGQVITGNHRVQGFKDFSPESRAAYERAIKDRFNIELASDELLLRTPSDDLSVKELLSIAYNSNKEDIKNLGDHIYSVLGRYAPNFAKLPRQLESSSVQELKSKIARILDPSPYPDENGANLALLANTIKADKNANITEMLNAFSKLDKEDADKTLSTFTDTAGLWHILSNNAVEYGLKQLDLRPYLLGAMYKSATSQHTTRAANFKELNAQIKHILDTTNTSGSNMMLEIMPNTYDNLIADLLGASLARFMRLENPSSNLYEALKGANHGIREQLAPRLDFEIGFTAGRNIEQADIFDFIEYMIREGDKGKEVAEAVELLPKLREKYNAFKGKDSALGRHSADLGDSRAVITDKVTPTPESPKNHESPTANPRILETESTPPQKSLFDTQTPAETPAQKVDSSVAYTDTKGHTHQIPADIAQQWLETFGLKDLQEAYTPQFSEQVAQALEPILQGESIKLYAGSLIKLIKENRLQYLDRIKPTLEQPQRVILQNDGALIFARDFGDEKYFTSVARNDDGEWIIRSNAPKSESGLDNKIAAGGREIYNSQAATQINAHSPYDDIAKSNTKLDSTIIPQQKPYTDEKKTLQGFEQAIAGKDTHTKIQIAKEKIKQLNKESRDLAYNAPTPMYLGKGYTKTRDKKYLDYRRRFRDRLKENGIGLDYMELEKLKQDTTLKGKARKEAMDTIYLRMYENMQQANKEAKERTKAFMQEIRERDLQEAKEWLEKNKGASSDLDYEYKRKIAEIDTQLDLAFKKDTKDTEFIDLMNRERGTLTYAKNGDLGVVRLPEVENFYWRGYPIDLKVLRDIQKEHNYTDKNLIINGRDFSKSFEVMRAEIEARIGIKPIKEFGTNYAEHYHSGESAIAKLLNEKQGQVAGAFHRKELGDIDLVWGEVQGSGKEAKGWGLAKIIEKHGDEFENIAKELDEIIRDGEVVKTHNGYNIELGDYKVGLNIGWNENGVKIGENKWVVTAFDKSKLQSEKQGSNSASLTKGETLPFNSSDIIPQTEISNIKKQLVELKESKSAYEKYLKGLERNMKDVELEERRYLRGEESIKVFERKMLIQSSIDKHTQDLNAVLKKMIELHKQLPENVRYTKEVLDDLTKIEAILKGNDYSLQQALRLSKITQRLQEKAIIESESFLNEVYNLDDFAKGAKSLQGTSYAYNTDDSIRKYFKIIAEMIDSIPAFKKISANTNLETPPKVDSSEAPPSKINFTYTTGEAKGIAELRKDLKAALEPYKSTPITNKETGLQGVVTDTERNKISSKKAVDKSIANGFTRDEHFTAAQDLKNLFENSTLKQSHSDYKENPNILQVHRFVKEVNINNKQAIAQIALFEKIEGKNRIYTLELESLSPTPPKLAAHTSRSSG